MDQSHSVRSDINGILNDSHVVLRQGNFDDAKALLQKAVSLDFNKDEIFTALKSISYWEERKKKFTAIQEEKKRGEYLFNEWENYLTFLKRCRNLCDDIHYPIKQWVFSSALTCFQNVLLREGRHDPDLLCMLGRAYKGIGDYEHAVEYFEAANHQKVDDPEILAELADAYAFMNEIKASKIFFREAFFIDPQKIKLDYLESMLISRVIEKVKTKKETIEEIKEWIPVYGNIYGVFNVKRELKPLEFGKLKQSIYNYETLIQNKEEAADGKSVPRLLNKYFWLIDHLLHTKSERKRIDEVLDKIKILDEEIYEKLIQ